MSDEKIPNDLNLGNMKIPFSERQEIYYKVDENTYSITLNTFANEKLFKENDDIKFVFEKYECDDYIKWNFKIYLKNNNVPDVIGIKTGIDTYMDEYPTWNNKFFPTMLRCEKTHFWGYFMSPAQKAFAIFCPQPISSYSFDYNDGDGVYFGHRIHTVNIEPVNNGQLPKRHPNVELKCGEWIERDFYFVPLSEPSEIFKKAWNICKIPLIQIDRTALNSGDYIKFSINTDKVGELKVLSPSGELFSVNEAARESGLYKIVLTDIGGKITEACVYVLKPYEWYLKQARKEAYLKPQKATTHAESWYGFYSAFLAQKHYPNSEIDELLNNSFDEIAPLMFDIEKGEPILIPERIQNTATFIGVLVDRYEADPKNNVNALITAAKFGDWLIKKQKDDGAYYRNGKLHYTCVIYIAKSMLELALAEKEIFPEKSKEHYKSAGRAVENLVELLECIGTEGEHTLEDGMLSCSALQIAMYALTKPQNEREKYINAAEHMLKVHECLEQNIIPDARMRGGTLRFWEAQYDVLIKGNMFNSPHGWSAWYAYATYYLYLLTGKKDYLLKTVNTMGSCLQLMSNDGDLRWGFISDPQIHTQIFVPDRQNPLKDGYCYVKNDFPPFAGKYDDVVLGEQYVKMISGWYRISEEKRVGGYLHCPLFFADRKELRSTQGGCCDNDVHEIFKCLEETLLKKAFITEEEENVYSGWNCSAVSQDDKLIIYSYEATDILHINIKTPKTIVFNKDIIANDLKGMHFLKIKNQ